MSGKPIILVDCDDVLADFETPALKLVAELGGPVVKPGERTVWDIGHLLVDEGRQKRFWDVLLAPGWCESLEPYPDALDPFRELSELGEVVVVTTPHGHGPTWAFERTRWLKKHFGLEDSHVANVRNKRWIHGDFLADDKPANLRAWNHGCKFLIDRVYNRTDFGFERGSLEDFVAFVVREKERYRTGFYGNRPRLAWIP